MTAELIFSGENVVGESVVWDDRRKRLLWIDIIGKSIHALVPATGDHQHWDTPDFVTSMGLRKDGGAIVAFTKKVCLWDYDDNFHPLATIEADLPNNRLNEGIVGPDGAFWLGTMQNNFAADGSPMEITELAGRLYRCTAEGAVEAISNDRFGITNTFVWPNDKQLITADTRKNEIYCYDMCSANGHLTDRRGNIDRVVELPCTWPTSCAFGGEDLSTLYITSARFTMDPDYLSTNPQEGGLFAINPGVPGLQSRRFG